MSKDRRAHFVTGCLAIFMASFPTNRALGQDCNTNAIPDPCDIACGSPGGPCDVIGCGLSSDCNSNGTPDECESPPPVFRDAIHRGWWNHLGFHDASVNNTFTGQEASGPVVYNSYFIFDVTGISPPGDLTLHLEVEGYLSPDLSETLTVYDVSTDVVSLEQSGTNTAIFNDLQSGNAYATFQVTPANVGQVLSIPLNTQAIPDMTASGGLFAIGLHVETVTRPTGSEGVRFSLLNENRIHRLELGQFTDCNINGTLDVCDIVAGTSSDCDSNQVPDECDPDCNTNGSPDACDIASHSSLDCNTNGIPDECETDCNSNLIPDSCDIAMGPSADCNSNTVPDECDIAAGTSMDCNNNSVPDECDLSAGTSLDCNSTSVPDECELGGNDCNSNLIPDACDLASEASPDCNLNMIPDECELAGNDCNSNGIPDSCDVAEGTAPDCNLNNSPDSCDVSGGLSPDCQPNGIPDECELVGVYSADSGVLTPFDSSTPKSFILPSPALAQGNVTLAFEASADLLSTTENVTVDLNGHFLGTIFTSGASDCATVPNTAQLVVPAATYNGIIGNGAATLRMVASPEVNPGVCSNSSIRVQISYNGFGVGDCNANGEPDDCDLATNPALDCDSNGNIDTCGDPDCNSNGVVDTCDITGGTSLDCNSNGVPDECDIAHGTLGRARVAFFFDTAYVDDVTEARLFRDALIGRGHTVTTFGGVTATAWTAALAAADVLVVPELDSGDLFAAMEVAARSAVQSFVADGGDFVQAYCRDSTTTDLRLLNEIFGAGLTTRDTFGGPLNLDPVAASGSIFSGGPSLLPASNETNSLRVNELPPGALAIYSNGTQSTLATWGYGRGRITWLGFDFTLSPTPTEWIEVADRAMASGLSRDCNSNGIPDECDLGSGLSGDCNSNGVPDECEPDCNSNGTPDGCDIVGPSSDDCNSDGIPDDCQLAGNDCNANSIPDDCEPDCNVNDIPDDCDIVSGFSPDCDSDGLPDDCEIVADETESFEGGMFTTGPHITWTNPSSGPGWFFTSSSFTLPGWAFQSADIADSQSTGVTATLDFGPLGGSVSYQWAVQSESCCDRMTFAVDETTIFTHSGTVIGTDVWNIGPGVHALRWLYSKDGSVSTGADAAAIDNVVFDTSATTGDCNSNSILDNCEITANPSIDCNSDGIIDSCNNEDCNGNSIPDECDVAHGTSLDCNSNGVPDECDLIVGSYDVAKVALFFDTVYVDDVTEARLLRDALINRGHAVTTFVGVTTTAWTTALSAADVLVVPELDGPDLFAAMSVAARTAVRDFVFNGGSFVQAYCRESTTTDLRLLNEIFSAGLTTRDSFGGPLTLNAVAAMGTVFEGGPLSLPASNETNSLRVAELPLGARAIYSNGTQTTLATWTYGSGRITWLGFDFTLSPTPTEWIEVADRAARVRRGIDCNSNNIPDECDIDSGVSQDCNSNGVPDDCDLAQGDQEDCNSNNVLDECDLASGESQDCNTSGILDECELALGISGDCNSNGVPDECDADCNTNGVADECDIAAATSADCQSNGVPDECELFGEYSTDSGLLSPIDSANPRTYNIPSPPQAAGPVTLDFQASADLQATTEFITVDLNGTVLGTVFVNGATDCPAAPNTGQLVIPATMYNGLIGGGTAALRMVASTDVNPGICVDPYVRVQINYEAAGAGDCNSNGIPDDCDVLAGISQDCQTDGIPDECQLPGAYQADSGNLGPIDSSRPRSFIIAFPPLADGNVVFSFQASADLASSDEYIDFNLNGEHVESMFVLGASDCASSPNIAQVPVSEAEFNRAAASGMIEIVMKPSPAVGEVCSSSYIRVSFQYQRADCNSNDIPDECEIVTNDCNGNDEPDDCDIAAGTSFDTNSNGIPDECEVDVRFEQVVRQFAGMADATTTLPSSDPTIAPGSDFVIELWASDVGLLNTGLVGVFADLSFTPGRFEALAIDHRPPFTLFGGGAIDNVAGTIEGLGGVDSTFSCPGKQPEWVRVAVVECRALPDLCGIGPSLITLSPSPFEVSACSRGAIPENLQQLGSATVAAGIDCVYDRTGDGFINAGDLGVFAGSWLTATGHPNYVPRNDFDCSGFVAAGDLGWFAAGWLRACDELTNIDLPPCRRCVEPSILEIVTTELDGWALLLGRTSEIDIGRAAVIGVGPDRIGLLSRFVRQSAGEDSTTSPLGQPSQLALNAGDSFYLELWTRDDTVGSLGLTAVYADVVLDASQIVIDAIEHGSIFTMLSGGNPGTGRIDRLGGATLSEGIAVGQWTRVARVRMTASMALPNGPSLTVVPSLDGVAALGRGSVSVWENHHPQDRHPKARLIQPH